MTSQYKCDITKESSSFEFEMKLFNQFTILCGLVSGKNPKASYCDTTDLVVPVQAEKWDCTGATGNMVPSGTKCILKCNAGYDPTKCKLTL